VGERARGVWGAVGAGVLVVSAGCGGDGGEVTGRDSVPPSRGTTTTSTTSSTLAVTVPVAESGDGRVDGVAVILGQHMVAPHPWWWVVDLADGVTIEGSSRVLVEVPQDEVGCGAEHRPIGAFQIEEGDAVSFELVDGEPGERPRSWFGEVGASFESEPAVRGRQFRVACPDGTEAAATELAAQRSIWERVGPGSYEFSMSWYLFSDMYGDYRITVVDSDPVSIVRNDGTQFDPARIEGDLPRTIDELFDFLERDVSAESFVATYDPELGFPRSVMVDEMLNSVDDELEVRVDEFIAGASPPPAVAPAPIGQRIDVTPIDWYPDSPDGVSFWLVVDADGGVTVDGSSRLTVQISVDEVRCGPEQRPIGTLQSLEGGVVSFELVATDAGPLPNDSPMWTAGPAVTGRQLHIPICPPTTEDLLAELDTARTRWAAAGIDDYELDLIWSPTLPGPTMFRITVADGHTTSVVRLDESHKPGPAVTDPSILESVPTTVEEVFDWLAAEIPVRELRASYHPDLGHPDWISGGTDQISVRLTPTDG
jgi:Family of unknown function (DUF6174)